MSSSGRGVFDTSMSGLFLLLLDGSGLLSVWMEAGNSRLLFLPGTTFQISNEHVFIVQQISNTYKSRPI